MMKSFSGGMLGKKLGKMRIPVYVKKKLSAISHQLSAFCDYKKLRADS